MDFAAGMIAAYRAAGNCALFSCARRKADTMTISRSILLTGLALAGVAAPAHAQGFLGQPVDVTDQFSGITLVSLGTQTITAAGNTFPSSGISAFITPTTITYSIAPNTGGNQSVSYVATETGSTPTDVFSATIDPATTIPGFTPGAISFDSKDVFADFTGINYSGGQNLVIDYTTAASAPVPEASTTVSFGLLLGLGGALVAAKRKHAQSAL